MPSWITIKKLPEAFADFVEIETVDEDIKKVIITLPNGAKLSISIPGNYSDTLKVCTPKTKVQYVVKGVNFVGTFETEDEANEFVTVQEGLSSEFERSEIEVPF